MISADQWTQVTAAPSLRLPVSTLNCLSHLLGVVRASSAPAGRADAPTGPPTRPTAARMHLARGVRPVPGCCSESRTRRRARGRPGRERGRGKGAWRPGPGDASATQHCSSAEGVGLDAVTGCDRQAGGKALLLRLLLHRLRLLGALGLPHPGPNPDAPAALCSRVVRPDAAGRTARLLAARQPQCRHNTPPSGPNARRMFACRPLPPQWLA